MVTKPTCNYDLSMAHLTLRVISMVKDSSNTEKNCCAKPHRRSKNQKENQKLKVSREIFILSGDPWRLAESSTEHQCAFAPSLMQEREVPPAADLQRQGMALDPEFSNDSGTGPMVITVQFTTRRLFDNY
jgi:hypothetical protein